MIKFNNDIELEMNYSIIEPCLERLTTIYDTVYNDNSQDKTHEMLDEICNLCQQILNDVA